MEKMKCNCPLEEDRCFCDNPLKEGYVRLYEDHTGRWYEDVTIEENKKRIEEMNNDPLYQILMEEIQKEINSEVVRLIAKNVKVDKK